VIEVDVHQQLREFLREQGQTHWPHSLTVARLVARALRLQRSALIQVGSVAAYQGSHRVSYLAPLLLSAQPAIIVAPEPIQQQLLRVEIPRLCASMRIAKSICAGDRWPHPDFAGLLLTTPVDWLANYLEQHQRFPDHIPTLIDGAEDLEDWARQYLTVSVRSQDWADLMLNYPQQAELIRNIRVQLTRLVFQHPTNPYGCVLIDAPEQDLLCHLHRNLKDFSAPPANWQRLWQQLKTDNHLFWAQVDRDLGLFSLHAAPTEIASVLQDLWQRQPVVLIGGGLDADASAPFYRQRIGLDEITSVRFAPDRQTEAIQLYLPDRMPMPNTPEFQPALLQQLYQLLSSHAATEGLAVVIVDDLPLKAQVGSLLAAKFGSRVQVEPSQIQGNEILVAGWQFWQQQRLSSPNLLIMATLPLPSLEDPRVAGQVAYYKRLRQDWFRLYLLPVALGRIERAIAPVRERSGVVALLDPRAVYRSYGQQILSAFSPYIRINYLDPDLLTTSDFSAWRQ
jgi:ATP-dependent DNA helicase DinG